MTVPTLYEDDHVVVVNKPSGLVVHSDGRTGEPTLADWVLEHYPGTKDVGEPLVRDGVTILRPGIVHRLDRDTSGVLVIAKDQKTFGHLKRQFQEREVTKVYHAFVYGDVKKDEGVIDRPIGKSKKDFRQWSAQRGARGEMREAITEYRVLGRGGGASYLEVRPATGRTHQIRVHLKAIHHPVVCDPLYAPKQPALLGLSRLALHASSLTFTLPSGKALTVEAPLSDDMRAALAALTDTKHASVAGRQAL